MKFKYILEYGAARLAFAVVGALPESAGGTAGRALGRLAGLLIPARSRRAAENLRAAFPEAAPGQIDGWVRGMWRNMGQAAWEFARMPSLTRESYFRNVRVEGLELLQASHAKGKGAVLYAGHITNWEWASLFMAFAGLPIAAVARRMKNPYFDVFLTGVRSAHGVTVISHKNAVREGMRWIKAGKCLGILVDQRITAGGVQVPFFGRPAHTTTMPGLLAMRTGAALHGLSVHREGDRMLMRVHPALDLAPFNGDAAAVAAACTADVERWIRLDPSAWLWMHDRWKP